MTFWLNCTIVRLHMKKSLLCRTAMFGTALFLSVFTAFPVFAAGSSNTENGIGPGYEEVTDDNDGKPSSPLDAAMREVAARKAKIVKAEEETAGISSEETEAVAGPSVETGTPGESLGIFRISGYCGCERCSGNNVYTYSGVLSQANHTLSADLDLFPVGTKLWIGGIVYTVEDMGGGIDGDRLDIYFDTHEESLDYGLKNVEVFTVLPEN